MDDDLIELFAAKYYDNPACCSRQEFMSDVKLLRHVKREMAEPELSYRPLLNLIVILSNVFGDGVEGLVFSAIEQDRWKLVPFLDKIGRLRRYNIKLADGSRINLPYDPREDAIRDKLSTI